MGKIALLSRLQTIYNYAESRSYTAHVCLWHNIQRFYRIDGGVYSTPCLACMLVLVLIFFLLNIYLMFQELEHTSTAIILFVFSKVNLEFSATSMWLSVPGVDFVICNWLTTVITFYFYFGHFFAR